MALNIGSCITKLSFLTRAALNAKHLFTTGSVPDFSKAFRRVVPTGLVYRRASAQKIEILDYYPIRIPMDFSEVVDSLGMRRFHYRGNSLALKRVNLAHPRTLGTPSSSSSRCASDLFGFYLYTSRLYFFASLLGGGGISLGLPHSRRPTNLME